MNITKISFSKLKVIEDFAFQNSGISKIVFPESIESIGKCAFNSCLDLEEIIIPQTSRKVEFDETAFQGCNLRNLLNRV